MRRRFRFRSMRGYCRSLSKLALHPDPRHDEAPLGHLGSPQINIVGDVALALPACARRPFIRHDPATAIRDNQRIGCATSEPGWLGRNLTLPPLIGSPILAPPTRCIVRRPGACRADTILDRQQSLEPAPARRRLSALRTGYTARHCGAVAHMRCGCR